MRHRPVVTLLMLVIAVTLALPAGAQQKPVAPTFRACPERSEGSARADLKVSATIATFSRAYAAMMLAPPAGTQQEPVAPTPPRTGSAKPFTQDQVQAMVRDGLGDGTGAKAIEQRGIDFAPTEDLLLSLKAAGANEAFLAALRAAKHPQPADGPDSGHLFREVCVSFHRRPARAGDLQSGSALDLLERGQAGLGSVQSRKRRAGLSASLRWVGHNCTGLSE
jgi:hypothetical protein